jgi:hypothetical protein
VLALALVGGARVADAFAGDAPRAAALAQ